tara:strand:- start:44 stop:919 length:876 start_codon:yes stop_codon:yes gene_type:complete
MKDQKKPELTIGMPVHNGESHISKSLECLARQTYGNFKVIVFENQSTDNTLEIIKVFCEKDKRFSVIPSKSFLSALDNFKRAFKHISKDTDFFALRAHDDYSSDSYMEILCETLIEHPNKDLSVSSVKFVNSHGNKDALINASILEDRLWTTFKRPFSRIQFPASWIYGVYRSNSIDKIFETLEYYPNAWAGDRLVVLNYLFDRKLIFAPKAIFRCTLGSDSYSLYSEKSLSSKIKARIRYFQFVWSCRSRLDINSFYAYSAFFALCFKTSARDTNHTFETILKSYFRTKK